ncbi:hypothetical protein PGT21_034170 [Puccinia graminis f. sp. tritici]|uniref:Uncharacterized protein n=1 Tax=Puccinia graminis f. sp. tritici TaxID=56615 RepID=A0A5B0QY63_PUCGR|nr:hypothetical protein PGT21_034170 [Puccinia graminis f. sp. tritici]
MAPGSFAASGLRPKLVVQKDGGLRPKPSAQAFGRTALLCRESCGTMNPGQLENIGFKSTNQHLFPSTPPTSLTHLSERFKNIVGYCWAYSFITKDQNISTTPVTQDLILEGTLKTPVTQAPL